MRRESPDARLSPAGRTASPPDPARDSSPSARLMRSLSDLADGTTAAFQDVAHPTAARRDAGHKWRHTLGIVFLLVTVVLWTASSFLASTIFADNSYSKPYFVTYVNAAFFTIPLAPMLLKRAREQPGQYRECLVAARDGLRRLRGRDTQAERTPFLAREEGEDEEDSLNKATDPSASGDSQQDPLSLLETLKISFEFCFLWVC
jgi:solute carrier family 35, member F5